MFEVALSFFLISIALFLVLIFIKLNDISCHLSAIRRKADLLYSVVDVLNKICKCFKSAQAVTFENKEESEEKK